ncbi:MAG: patatin-like phospholipase family protein, partial [Anaerolineae bacterium]|nr:patatin-like phospholipase family protein [Anaerolineae bacterium]
IAALDDSIVVKFPRNTLDRLEEQHPALMLEFVRSAIPRFQRTQLRSALAPLFGYLSPPSLDELCSALEWRHLASGETLFRQGDQGDALYIVVYGRLRVVVESEGGAPRVLGEMGQGESVGEESLLTGFPRSATVYAIRDTELVRLSATSFEQVVERHPHAMMLIARMIAVRRQQQSAAPRTARPHSPPCAFAIIQLSPSLPVSDFAHGLAETLSALGPTLHLNSVRVDSLLGQSGMAQTQSDHPVNEFLQYWLTEQETKYRYLVYEADPTWSEWTARCLRAADRILLVAAGDMLPLPSEIEMKMARMPLSARKELVLVHGSGRARPAGTSKWLEHCKPDAYHHVRLHLPQDLGRLTRRLLDRAIGLVFSGGGARGFAHVGVVRALEEAGVPVDVVGGTSMGALVAASYAMGSDYQTLVQQAARFASPKALMDYTLPLASLFATRKVTAMLRDLFDDIHLEDLWQPFFCISSNLTQAEPFIHRTGPVWEAVRASLAIPGIFLPVLRHGDILVDGGVMNNFPIDVMRDFCKDGLVIGSTSSPLREVPRNYQFDPGLSGWGILWGKLNPLANKPRVPSILYTLMRSAEVNSVYRMKSEEFQNCVDVLIRPSVERFRMLDWGAFTSIIEIGYQTARQELQLLEKRQGTEGLLFGATDADSGS